MPVPERSLLFFAEVLKGIEGKGRNYYEKS